MSVVESLLNKALSTSSEEEAISTLRLARKRFSKGCGHASEGFSSQGNSDTVSQSDLDDLQDLIDKLDVLIESQDIEIAGHNVMYNYMSDLNKKLIAGCVGSAVLVVVQIGVIVWLV